MRRPSNTVLNNLAFALALAILVLLAWQGKRTQDALLRQGEAERASLELITVIQGMLSALQDVETGARGYILTGTAAYLEPYADGREQLVIERKRLGEALLARDPANAAWLESLDRDIHARLGISAENIQAREQGLVAAAAHLAGAGGKGLMDRLRARLGLVESIERERLQAARAAVQRQYDRGRRQLMIGGTIVGLLLVGGLLAMNRNLMARRRLVQQAQAQRGFLRSVTDADENLIFVRDASGCFTLCNRAFARLLAMTPGDIEGHLPADLPGVDRIATLLEGDDALFDDGPDLERELLVVDPAGQERWFQVHKQAISLPNGSQAILSVAVDISARRQLERMKSEFVSTVSHELRTPLTAIRGALGMVIGGMAGEVPESSRPLLAIADKNSERLVSLINDILDIEKLDAGRVELQLQASPLRPLLEQAIEQNTPYATQFGVSLSLQDDTGALVRVDPDRFAQVMANLLSNAVKHSPRNREVVVDAVRMGDTVEIGVRDQGVGIPPDFQHRVFQRFAQADASDARRRGGTGLGLAITKALVEQHGGTIGFDTTPGVGTRFHVRLPVTEAVDLPRAAAEPDAPILVVDDDPDSAGQLADILRSSGYVPVVAAGGADARSRLAEGAFRGMAISLALRDEDALSVIADLRAHASYRHLPVLGVVVQAEQPGGTLEGSVIGVGDWLRKPFDPERVLEAVLACIDGTDRTPQVLHVEDDADLRTLVAGLLAGEPLDLHGAGTLAEARAALAVRRHDLVILDLMLPDGDGAMLLDELAAARPAPRVIIFSARDTELPESSVVMQRLVKSRQGAPELASLIREHLRRWPRAAGHPGGTA